MYTWFLFAAFPVL